MIIWTLSLNVPAIFYLHQSCFLTRPCTYTDKHLYLRTNIVVIAGISDGPSVSALTNGLDTPEERYEKLKKVKS